jgi:hypothetical protein
MMGCPLLRYGQEFFVDFDTNTDLDNVYMSSKITHNIKPGSFTTSLQLKPTYKGSPTFQRLISDIHSTVELSQADTTTDTTTTAPTTTAAE